MADTPIHAEEKLGWSFPRTFWFANGAELCERAAYYGMFITLMRYLNQDIGFTDVETGIVTGHLCGWHLPAAHVHGHHGRQDRVQAGR